MKARTAAGGPPRPRQEEAAAAAARRRAVPADGGGLDLRRDGGGGALMVGRVGLACVCSVCVRGSVSETEETRRYRGWHGVLILSIHYVVVVVAEVYVVTLTRGRNMY